MSGSQQSPGDTNGPTRIEVPAFNQTMFLHALGVALGTLATVLIGIDRTGGRIALGITTGIAAAAAIQVAWKVMGGTPLDLEVKKLKDAVNDLRSANATMADLEAAGIEHVYPERTLEMRAKWSEAVGKATKVDLMGLSLYGLWFRHDELCRALEAAANRSDTTVRVLTLPSPDDAESVSRDQRMQQPAEEEQDYRLPGLLKSTYSQLARLPNVAENHVTITTSTLYSSIVRIDNYVYVAPYMASVEGDDSLAFEASGPGGKAFQLYTLEFDKIWEDETRSSGQAPDTEGSTSPDNQSG